MTRTVSVSIENNFKGGLVTEVTGVNSPENSVTATLNVSYDRKGRASTRKGFELEDSENPITISTTGNKTEFVWETVSDNANRTFTVLQLGSKIRFMSSGSGEKLINGFESFEVDLVDYKSGAFSVNDVRANSCSFASGKGYLFIAHPCCDPIYVKYNKNNTISVNSVSLRVRDFEAVDDNLDPQDRPTNLSVKHEYNLKNQGWYAIARGDDDGDKVQVLDFWAAVRNDYPSNVDAWWYYMDSENPDRFNPANLADYRGDLYGNTPAPKGHYIINPLASNRSGKSGVAGVPELSSDGYRPSVIAFFSGRVFYAGIGHPDYSSTIYFSPIIQDDADLGKCYQINDPTSKESFDLLPSDGGTVKIQDINTVLHLQVIGPSLLIFASNGVWSVTGSNDGPFKATDYFITKVSSFPALSKTSIVDVGGLPIWWNYEGIFSIQKDTVGTPGVQAISEQTIQSFYDEIPLISKEFAKGCFNDQEGLVYWLYNKTAVEGYSYSNILVLDTLTKAFYVYSIPPGYYDIFGLVAIRATNPVAAFDEVTTSTGDTVVTSLGDPVVVQVTSTVASNKKIFKFLCAFEGDNLNVASLTEESHLDWGYIPYETYFITGYRIRGDLLKEFQTNYLTIISESDVSASCFVQGIWNYADSPDSGKYTNPQRVIRLRPDRTYQRSRLKIRGQGYSLQFKFYGEAGKPFTIVGWAGFETANGSP